MQQALYAPNLGYYRAGLRKFGAQGDFVTAPELSPLFSQCLARQCAEVFATLAEEAGHFSSSSTDSESKKCLASPSILEFGAGSGVMAADILAELERLESLPEQYCILEISAELQQRQRETIQAKVPHLLANVVWLQALPERFRGVVLGNEVLDAMPVQRFRIGENGDIEEAFVACNGEAFVSEFKPANSALRAAVQTIVAPFTEPVACPESEQREVNSETARKALPIGYVSEWNPHLQGWFKALFASMQQGVVLLIDYGFPRREFYHPQRNTGTLMCHYRHYAHSDALLYPGLQDITAHVDFTAVAQAAYEVGFRIEGYTPQMYFLLLAGLQDILAASDALNVAAHSRLVQPVQPLIMPQEMGELFKVIALSKDLDIVFSAFQQNFKDRL